MPVDTGQLTGLGTLLLEAIRPVGLETRCQQPSSSQMFGGTPLPPDERYLGNLDGVRDWGYGPGVRKGDVADAPG